MSSRDIEVTVRRQLAVTQPLQFTRSVAGRLQPNTELITCAVTRVESDSQTGATDKNCLEFGLSQLHCKSEPWPAALQPQLQPSISTRRRPALISALLVVECVVMDTFMKEMELKTSVQSSREQKSLTYFSTGCVVFPSCQPAAQMQVERRIFLNISIEKSIQAHWSTREKWVNNKPTECPSPTAPSDVVYTAGHSGLFEAAQIG